MMRNKSLAQCCSKRGFFWGRNKVAGNIAASLIDKEEEIKIMQYRGRIDDFNNKAHIFEAYLKGEESTTPNDDTLIEGRATGAGTLRYKERAVAKGIPAKNFRKPYDLPYTSGDPTDAGLNLSTVGMGTFMGMPDDEDDFDMYIAAKYLLKSGTLNFLDTASNYRCQKSERTIGAVLKTLLRDPAHGLNRDEIFVSSKSGYVPDDADAGVPAAILIEDLKEQGVLTDADFAAGIHSMHPSFLEHQLKASQRNLGLKTIDLMYLHNSFEQQSHFEKEQDVSTLYMDKLAKAFEFYEGKRQEGEIGYYGMATWLCFRAKTEEEGIYLNLQKCIELAESIGGRDTHGFRFIQVPMSVLMPEAYVESWQEFVQTTAASTGEPEMKILVAICNLLKMNVIASKPLLEARVRDIDIPSIVAPTVDNVAKHLQLMRSMPPRCLISTMAGMKTLSNVKTNYSQVLTQEPINRKQFLNAMDFSDLKNTT